MLGVVKVVTLESEGKVLVFSPYHPDFPPKARRLGGQWKNQVWVFDIRVAEEVKQAVIDVYGFVEYPVEVTDVNILLDRLPKEKTQDSELWLMGRLIAKRPARDARVRLGKGVIIIAGGFPPRGGSRRYPALCPLPGTVLCVFDVPVRLYEQSRFREALEEVEGRRRIIRSEEDWAFKPSQP